MAGYQREDYYQPSGINTGQAELYGTLANRLSTFANRAKDLAETSAIPKAEQRGAEAAAAGSTKLKLPINKVAQAYNDSLVRAYALDTYAQVHEKLSQFEIDAGTDQAKFKASVAGYRQGLIPALMPAAQPIITRALQEREADGLQRIGTLKANETHAEAQAASERGRTELQKQISRGYTSGDPELVARADALTAIYLGSLEGDVQSGLMTRRAADAKRDVMFKDLTRDVAFGRLEEALAKPGGDPVAEIEAVLKDASPILSDEERMTLTVDMLQRLNVHQALVTESTQQETLALKAQWAAGEKQATHLLLTHQLTLSNVDRMLQADQLDPDVARTLRTALKEGDTVSDPEVEFIYHANVMSFSEQDIRDEPRLAWADKIKLLDLKRQQAGGWRDTNPAQEAAARIDRALGIVPGTLMDMLSEDQKRQRGVALTQWYDTVDALPEAERAGKAIPIAEEIIKRVIVQVSTGNVAALERRLAAYKQNKNPADMSKSQKATYDTDVAALEAAIARERAKVK